MKRTTSLTSLLEISLAFTPSLPPVASAMQKTQVFLHRHRARSSKGQIQKSIHPIYSSHIHSFGNMASNPRLMVNIFKYFLNCDIQFNCIWIADEYCCLKCDIYFLLCQVYGRMTDGYVYDTILCM